MSEDRIFTIDETLVGERLDKALGALIEEHSRTFAMHLIKEGYVTVNGELNFKPAYRVELEDEIIVNERPLSPMAIEAENIPLDIVYEDDDLLVVNKPAGMVVHPANGHYSGTLVNALLYSVKNLSGINGVKRPGIVHRIDKDTSGLLLVCKNDFAHEGISKQLADHSMHREYFALVDGVISEDDGKIIAPIGRDKKDRFKMAVDLMDGKEATTLFHVEERFNQYTLISCRLLTGRTHQIRVHMDYIGHPIEGDPIYGRNNHLLYQNGQLLHAFRLTFVHPRTHKEISVEAPLPQHFCDVLSILRNQEN
ncbi:MAG: RluA family pseudouridine synthase [Bacilli bacterium]|jgi:23S rRNA pseudouridine1911/1915/1917 synthase|nr:RluA family pseudouridine synthase [Bacilli bacterium]